MSFAPLRVTLIECKTLLTIESPTFEARLAV